MHDKDRIMVKAGFALSSVEAEQMVQFLGENHIAAYSKGGIMSIYAGNSVTGQEIMVAKEDLEKAKLILHSYTPIRTFSFRKNTEKTELNALLARILAAFILFLIVVPLGFIIVDCIF